MAAFVVAIISSALVWRIYICRAGEDLSSAFEVASTPARLGIAPAWVHLGMVAGIVVTSAGFQVFIAHPLGPGQLAWAVAMLAGPALFLACRTCFEYVVYARLFWSWPAGALALGILILPALFLPPLATAVTAAVVLAVIAIIDTAFYGRHRASRTPPQAPAAGTQ
jgi:low temperature requirement protein LtrA